MKELEPNFNRPTHITDFNTDDILLQIYKLLSFFLADSQITKLIEEADTALKKDQNTDRIAFGSFGVLLYSNFRERAIQSSALKIAIECRSIMEFLKLAGDMIVGKFLDDNKEELDFREACNKIIHSKSIAYMVPSQYDLKKAKKAPHFMPYVLFRGDYQKKQWCIELNIKLFCSAAIFVILKNRQLF